MAGEISFFELGVADAEQARIFYGGLFDWDFQPGPADGGGFAIRTPQIPGGLHGGDAGASPYLFFKVDDIEAALTRVLELGGTVEAFDSGGDADSIAKFGHFKLCRDNQGSPFGLHQPPAGQS
ncbi:VOC family protein [Streptomyces sp. NPDC051219]|uniref:VOC family protein n=1 Tax=Streptomyces sp. NPDC051219 TaxID=3155283 RepID=UPI00343810F0